MLRTPATLLALLLIACPAFAAEKKKREAKEPKAPPPRQQITPLADVIEKIDTAIGGIDRDTLTETKANLQLANVLKSFNGKRHTVSVSFSILDVEGQGGSTLLKMEIGDHPLAMRGFETRYARGKLEQLVQNADKGDVLTVTGSVVAVYKNGSWQDDERHFFIGQSEHVNLILVGYKSSLAKPKPAEPAAE